MRIAIAIDCTVMSEVADAWRSSGNLTTVKIEASYATAAELAADVDSQLGRGGLLVRGALPPDLQQFAPVDLTVRCGSAAIVVAAQVLQTFPGIGVAVAIDPEGRAHIIALLEAAGGKAAPARPARDTAPQVGPVEPTPLRTTDAADDPAPAVAAGSTQAPAAAMLAKIQRARNGDREARFAVLRDPNRNLHAHVLHNPGLALDEIAAIARMTTVSVDMLKQIAQRREWGHRPEIAIALIRNPTVPIPVAVDLIDHVGEGELRQLAKDARTREPIARAARKKLLR